MNLLVWGGPVQESNLKGVQWKTPTKVLVFNKGPDGGLGSNSFAKLAAAHKQPDGRILKSLLASRGASPDDFDQIAIAGFSAFHGLAAPLLASDGDRIAAAVLHDACFSSLANPPKPGYVSFGALAAEGQKLMVFTSSLGGGVEYSTGSACAQVNFTDAAKKAGVAPEPYEPPAPVPTPAKGTAARAGNLILLDYGDQFSHVQHVTKIGADVLNTYLVPYLAGEPSVAGATGERPGESSRNLLLYGAAAAALAAGGLVWYSKRRR